MSAHQRPHGALTEVLWHSAVIKIDANKCGVRERRGLVLGNVADRRDCKSGTDLSCGFSFRR